MEGNDLWAEKKAALQSYLGTTWRAEDGAAGSFRTADSRGGFLPAHIFWVLTREECDRDRDSIHADQLATVQRNGVDYFIFGEHSIEDLHRQREGNLQREAKGTKIEFSQHGYWDGDRMSVLLTATVDGKRVPCVVPQEYLTMPYVGTAERSESLATL